MTGALYTEEASSLPEGGDASGIGYSNYPTPRGVERH